MQRKNVSTHTTNDLKSLEVIRGAFIIFGGNMNIEQIFTFENLYNSHKKCRCSKQQKGEVIRFEINLGSNIKKIMDEILSKKYKIGEYKKFYIYEPKERLIEALPYKDRVIIHCFCEYCLIPKIEKKLIYDNVACRKNKGTLFGIERLKYFLRSAYRKYQSNNFYYLKCDISKYFPNINHKILMSLLEKANFSSDEIWFLNLIFN